MIYIVKINNKAYEVEVEKGTANILKTTLAEPSSIPAAVPVIASAVQISSSPISLGNGEPVNAPMPGTIMEIKTTVGMHVKKGDCLVILEAMKMENEIVAPSDGTVKQILAIKGSMVSTGDPLVVIG